LGILDLSVSKGRSHALTRWNHLIPVLLAASDQHTFAIEVGLLKIVLIRGASLAHHLVLKVRIFLVNLRPSIWGPQRKVLLTPVANQSFAALTILNICSQVQSRLVVAACSHYIGCWKELM
jgi:hypothetical protein